MIIHSKIQLRLIQQDFKQAVVPKDYSIIFVTQQNYKIYAKHLGLISKLMKQELDWEGTPDLHEIKKRLHSNSNCLLWVYKNLPVGWAWNNKNVTFNWIDIDKELEDGAVYGGGAFLSKSTDLPSSSSFLFYNLTFDFWLNQLNASAIYQYSDSWNRASTILSFKCGFKRYEFLD